MENKLEEYEVYESPPSPLGQLIGIMARLLFIPMIIFYLLGWNILATIFLVIWIIIGLFAWIFKL